MSTSYRRKYSVSKDANHGPIEEALRRCLGDHVTSCARAGDGIPDIFISFGGEMCEAYCCWVEVKRDDKADYTAAQIRFKKNHPGCVYRVETTDQAITLAQHIRQMVKRLAC